MRIIYALLAFPLIALSILTTQASAQASGGPCDQFEVGAMESDRGVAGIEEKDGSFRLTDSNETSCRTFMSGISTLINVKEKISATFVGSDLVTLYSLVQGEESRMEFVYNQNGTSDVKVTLYQQGKLPETDLMEYDQVNELTLLVTGYQPQAVDDSNPTPAN
jgi:hypothetical protein